MWEVFVTALVLSQFTIIVIRYEAKLYGACVNRLMYMHAEYKYIHADPYLNDIVYF